MSRKVSVNKGDVYGRLTILKEVASSTRRKVSCVCECGNIKEVFLHAIRRGSTKSCGCLNKELVTNRNYKHGCKGSRLYVCWRSMKKRVSQRIDCNVQDDWLDFSVFQEWALANGYQDNLVLCRKDDKGDYREGNVRWDTPSSNAVEGQACYWKITTPSGEVHTVYNMKEYCRKHNLNQGTISAVAKGKYQSHKGYSNVIKYQKGEPLE